jgi:hypothetical protein
VDADNLLLLFVFYLFIFFSIRVLASTLVDANNLSLVSTFNVDADNRVNADNFNFCFLNFFYYYL